MTTMEIAERLVALCRQGDFETAQRELYAADAINIEPYATPAFAKETKGLNAIIEKGHKFAAMIEQVHSISTTPGKQLLERIVSMLWRMIESQQSNPDHSTRMSTSTMTIASPSTRAALSKRDR